MKGELPSQFKQQVIDEAYKARFICKYVDGEYIFRQFDEQEAFERANSGLKTSLMAAMLITYPFVQPILHSVMAVFAETEHDVLLLSVNPHWTCVDRKTEFTQQPYMMSDNLNIYIQIPTILTELNMEYMQIYDCFSYVFNRCNIQVDVNMDEWADWWFRLKKISAH